jgi:dual specificity tyrosine-phosphorylation-regulated kinase 2/3/4
VYDHKSKEFLAIKVVKKSKELVQQTFVEISILTHIKENDKGNTSGIVRIKDFLLFRNHIVIFNLFSASYLNCWMVIYMSC